MAGVTEREINLMNENLNKFMGEMRKSVEKIETSVSDNSKAITLVERDLTNHIKSQFTERMYITVIIVLVGIVCTLIGHVWTLEKPNNYNNAKQEKVINRSTQEGN